MASLDDKETLLKIGIAIDETQFQQKVASAIGEAEKMKEVRIPINVDGKDGIRVIRSYRDEMNNLIKTTQDFIMAKNGLVGAKNEKIVDVSTIKKAESAYDALIAKIQKYDAEVTKDNTNTKRTVASYDELKQSMELVSEGGIKAITYEGQNLYQREVQLKDANTGLIQTYTQLSTNGQSWTSTLTNIDKATVQNNTHIDALTSKIKSLDPTFNSLTGKGETIVTDVKEATKGLNVLSTTTSNVVHQGELLKKTTTEYGDSAKGTKKVIETYTDQHGKLVNVLKSTTERTRDLGVGLSNFTGTLAKVAQFKIITDALNLMTQSMSEAINIVKEYDDAITELQKVSDLSGQALEDYTKSLGEMSDEVGRTRTELVSLATNFEQAGYDDSDSKTLARVAALYQNVADSEVSASDASAFVVSQMKAFNLTAEQAESIVDKLNATSNAYSVTNTDLAQGLTKNASALSALGNTQDEIIGMVTAGAEIMKGQASTVSKGLSTIGININKVAQSSKTLEISVNGATKQIELFDETGNQLSTFDVLSQIADQWDEMTSAEQTAIASSLAGKTRFNVFTSVLSNFNDAIGATSTSMTSFGSAEAENEKRSQSLGYKLNVLKGQFEEFVLGDGGLQDACKIVLDLSTAILKFINSSGGQFILWTTVSYSLLNHLVTAIQGLKTIDDIAKASAFQKFIVGAQSGITSLKTFGRTASEVFSMVLAKELTAKEGMEILVAEIGTAQVALGVFVAVVAGAVIAYKALQDFSFQGQVDQLKDTVSEADNAKTKAEELEQQLSEIKDRIKEINDNPLKTTDDGELARLKAEETSLSAQLSLQKSIAEVKQQQAKNEAVSAVNSYVPTSHTYDLDNIRNPYGISLFAKSSDVLKNSVDGINQVRTAMAELDKQMANGELTNEQYQTQMGRLNEILADAQNQGVGVAQNYQIITEAGGVLTDEQRQLAEQFVALSNATTETAQGLESESDLLSKISDSLGEPIDSTEELAEKMEEAGLDVEAFQEAVASGDWATAYGYACQLVAEGTDETTSALKEQLSAITSLYDSYGTLQQAVADFNTNGYIDPSNLKELLSLGDEYLSLLQITDGQLSINEAGFEALANAQYDKAEADAYEEYTQKMTALAQAEAKGTLDELQTATNSYSTEPMNAQLQNLVQHLGLAVDGFNELAIASANVNIKTNQGKDLAKQYSSSLQTQLTFIEAGRKGIGKHTASIKSNTKATGSNTSSRKSNTGSTKSNTDAQKANTEALKKNVEALKKQKEAIEKEKEDMEKVISYIEDKVNDYIDELEDAKDAETDLIDDALDGLDDIKDALDDAFDEDNFDKLNKIMDESVKKLNELNAELQKLRSEGKNTTGVEKEIEALNKSLEIQKQIIQYKKTAEDAQAEEKRIKDEIDRLKEENDELEQQLEYKELLDNLAKAQQTRLKVYKEGQGFVYTEDQSAISEAQRALDEWLRKKKLNDQIKQLEDQRDKQKEIYDQQVENLDNLQDDCDELYDQMNKDLEQYKNQVEKRWDDQINYYKNWLEEFKKGVNSYETEQNRLLALEKTGIDFEQQGWQTRLSNLNSFVESYKAKLAELEEATRRLNEAQQAYEQAQAQASASGVSSGGGGGGSGAGSGSGNNGGNPPPAQTPRTPTKITPFAGQVFSYNSGLSYRFLEGSDKSWHTTTTAWQHGFKVQKVFSNGDAYVKTKSGKLALVRASEWNVDKVRRSNNKNAYASGASSIQDDQMALVGDSPSNNELVIGSKLNGQFMNLKKGSGVVNATSTNTLAGLLNQLPKLTGHSINATTNNTTSSNDTVFSIGNITIDGANITDINSFKNALINIKSEAVQRAYQH